MPDQLQIGAMLTFSLDKRSVIASFVRLSYYAVALYLFITLVRTMYDGYNNPQVNVAYEQEIDGFELPMVAMCGQMLNLGAFSASISGSEEEVDIQNRVSVDNLFSLLNPRRGCLCFHPPRADFHPIFSHNPMMALLAFKRRMLRQQHPNRKRRQKCFCVTSKTFFTPNLSKKSSRPSFHTSRSTTLLT
jgi:hypothetical protein